MSGYLVNFSIYTMAMIGLIFFALFVFKTFSNKCFSKKSSSLSIGDSINLSPRKTLYLINVENQRYLIASDVDRTSLIAKLDNNNSTEVKKEVLKIRQDKSSELSSLDGVVSMNEFSSKLNFKNELSNGGFSEGKPMMKELARKVKNLN